MLYGFLRVSEKGEVLSKQQLSDEFVNGFRVCEETREIEQTAVSLKTDEDAT